MKNRFFLICASVNTEVDNKRLSARLGVKESAPLRLADEQAFDSVLAIPRGSVNPFVMINGSTQKAGVTLLLDQKFKGSDGLLFHPGQNDATTKISSADLDVLLEARGCAHGLAYQYVDFSEDSKIVLGQLAAGSDQAPAAKPAAAKPKKVRDCFNGAAQRQQAPLGRGVPLTMEDFCAGNNCGYSQGPGTRKSWHFACSQHACTRPTGMFRSVRVRWYRACCQAITAAC